MEYQQIKEILNKQKAFFIKNGPQNYELMIDIFKHNSWKYCD